MKECWGCLPWMCLEAIDGRELTLALLCISNLACFHTVSPKTVPTSEACSAVVNPGNVEVLRWLVRDLCYLSALVYM